MHLMAKCKLVPFEAGLMRIARDVAGLRRNADGSLGRGMILKAAGTFNIQRLAFAGYSYRFRWSFSELKSTLMPMEGLFLADKPDPNKKLREVPHKPGVYLMKDRLKRVIYVGKARDLRKRLSQYFMPSRRMTADLKTRALLDSVWDFEVHLVRNEPEALLLEGKLIKEFRPKYNVSFRDDKRFLLVKVNLSDAIPRFQLTRLKK